MVLVTLEQNLNSALKKAEISPGIVPENFTPSTLVGVDYENGNEATLGNFIKPQESSHAPKVTFVAPEKDAHYSLLLVDPDAPSKQDPKWGPYRHWVLTNIPDNGDFQAASVLAPYIGPGPPPKTGDHRYIFLLFKQPSKNISVQSLQEESQCWDFKAFIQEQQLELVGVNFFISRNDDN